MSTDAPFYRIAEALERMVAQNDQALTRDDKNPENDERLIVAFERIATALEGIIGREVPA